MPPAAKSIKFPALILNEKGDITEVNLPAKTELTLANIKTFLKKKSGVELIGTYPYKQLFLFLFGCTVGKEGQENNHQLPPPHDSTPLYGDIVMVASKEEETFAHPVSFKPEEYEQFYTRSFGGMDGAEEDEDEEEVDVEAEVEAEVEVEVEVEAEVEAEEEVEEEEEEEEDEEEEDAAEEEAVGEEDAPVVAKPKAKKRKQAAKPSAAAANATLAYADKPILSEEEQLQEITDTTTHEPTDKHCKKTLAILQTLFSNVLSATQITELECAIYNGAIREAKERHVVRTWSYPLFVHLYMMYARRIISNFDPNSYIQNNELFQMVQSGNIDMNTISGMNTYELYPSRWKEQFDKQQIREKNQLEGNKAMATDQFLCTRCWKRQCTYYEMQTRSADEPMTIFITCLNCGKHWRQ